MCLSLAILALETTKRYRNDTKSISVSNALNVKFFPETTALKSYGVKTSEKPEGYCSWFVCVCFC